MVKGLRDLKQLPLEDVPEGFHGDLRPYQQLGMSWLFFLRQYGFGATLADDMGLGKTIQLITYLLKVKEAENSGTCLDHLPDIGSWQLAKGIRKICTRFIGLSSLRF